MFSLGAASLFLISLLDYNYSVLKGADYERPSSFFVTIILIVPTIWILHICQMSLCWIYSRNEKYYIFYIDLFIALYKKAAWEQFRNKFDKYNNFNLYSWNLSQYDNWYLYRYIIEFINMTKLKQADHSFETFSKL